MNCACFSNKALMNTNVYQNNGECYNSNVGDIVLDKDYSDGKGDNVSY